MDDGEVQRRALRRAPVPARERRRSEDDTTQPRRDQVCAACARPMTGQFVRALGGVYHLDCFRCADCQCTVASKFFSSTEDMVGPARRPFPLCETDYFRRLDLLCHQCGRALRGSYITALGAKYHVEHFTCSVCPTVFGPNDSYYEHGGRVYCHFHYSTRFAIQCAGCHTAILKQFVEINRNNADEHWHPECYMIHRYWKIKLGVPPPAVPAAIPLETLREMPGALHLSPASSQEALDQPEQLSFETLCLEATETPESLLHKQRTMETRVFTIWRVLSAYEESSAACISDMLRHVSNGKYLGGVRYAGRFVLHVEVLFSAIDRLEQQFARVGAQSIRYVREARMLCKKIVNFFSLFSHTQATGARRMGITQELLSLVTGVAHYLKILIRISLTGALRLDQAFGDTEALESFLATLDELVRQQSDASIDEVDTDTVHGYTSLPRMRSRHGAGSARDYAEGAASDLCAQCAKTVEEECVRVRVAHRWHWGCVRCSQCARGVQRSVGAARADDAGGGAAGGGALPAAGGGAAGAPGASPLPVPLRAMRYRGGPGGAAGRVVCAACAPDATGTFAPVSRLEQYAFLLCVALNRLRTLLHKKHASQLAADAEAAPGAAAEAAPRALGAELTSAESSTYRKSHELKRLETLYLDQHLSTTARVPRYSAVVGSGTPGRATRASSDAGERSPPPKSERSPVPGSGSASCARVADVSVVAGDVDLGAESDVPLLNPWDAEASSAAIVSVRSRASQEEDDERAPTELGTHLPSEEGITLADIPLILQAEQDREQLGGEGAAELRERRTYSSLAPEELYVLKHVALARLQQSPLAELVATEHVLELVDARRNTFWNRLLFKGGKDRRDVRKKGVFGVSLEWLVERNGADSTLGATPTPMRVPSFVDDVVSAMRQMDVSVEGIFRKNGNVRRLNELVEAVDREQDSVNLLEDNPVQLAALLKRFFRELPDALFTTKLHRLYLACEQCDVDDAERHRLLQLVTLLLPKAHRDTMEVLFVFLKWVASFSHVDEETGSRMDLPNLATVMCPNLLYTRSEPTRHEAVLANRVVAHLLERQDEFWVVREDLEPALADRALVAAAPDLGAAELLKRCAKYA
ncbi:Rho-type GTPase activating protein Rga1 [Malassezia brasiliensis]|uniref:Rho-type GTPase activating protein Rga1 n=1 Tax=Malassezia brasiliensis TaxID=1821822 RepID=A0AAF0IUJ3_9BASI|nr:Rho-type GTPase activating protein Rga1 [Malassezia brasiliensis]